MQNLDVTKTEAAWSSLAGKVYVPHSEEEYHRLVALLDSFIDEVGEDESHPLASLMEVVFNVFCFSPGQLDHQELLRARTVAQQRGVVCTHLRACE